MGPWSRGFVARRNIGVYWWKRRENIFVTTHVASMQFTIYTCIILPTRDVAVSWWRHEMDTRYVPHHWHFVLGNHGLLVNSQQKQQCRRFIVSDLIRFHANSRMCDEIRWFDAMWRHPNEMLHRVTALWIISTMWQSSRRSHSAPVSYPTMLHFVIEMCTCVHISLIKWSVVGYLCEALYDLWDGFIATTAYFLGPLLNMNVMIARFMGPTWGPPGADRTQVGPTLASSTLLSGCGQRI